MNRLTKPLLISLALLVLSACGGGSGDSISQTITLNISVDTPSEVRLNWTEHPDAGEVIGYDVFRNGEAAYPSHLSGTRYTDRDLEPLTHYCYIIYVVVWPAGGVGGTSNQVCITTPGTVGWNIETVGSGDNPALALDSSNQPHVSYRSSSGVMLSHKSGSTWLHSVVDSGVGDYGDQDLAVDVFNADHLSYADTINKRIMHASNTTGVWIRSEVDKIDIHANALAVDNSGSAHIVYRSNYLRYASNASGNWQSEIIDLAYTRDIDILMDASGTLHVVYAEAGIELSCTVRYAQNSDAEWNVIEVDSDAMCGVSLALDSGGGVHIAYPRKFGLAHAYYDGSNWQIEEVDDTFSWVGGNSVGLAIDGADLLHISYQDQNADLKYATNVSGIWERYFLDSSSDVGSSSIAVGAAGHVSVVYSDQANQTVKLMTSP